MNVFPGYTPSVYSDPCAIAKTGAEHLIGLGCKRFAFCCFKNSEASQSYRQAFEQAIEQVGGQCHVHEVDTTTLNWPSIWKAVSDWVAALPKPIGLMAVKDSLALEVLEACGDLGIRVPDQIAVVGMGNDKLLCERADPRLSSVDPGNAPDRVQGSHDVGGDDVRANPWLNKSSSARRWGWWAGLPPARRRWTTRK